MTSEIEDSIQAILQSANQVAALAEEVRAHTVREDRLLYPWAARELGKVAQAQIVQALATRRAERLASRSSFQGNPASRRIP
jgi:iron-sulfur cluster repair protein YtfE (RIC family)